jgi:hypothetical protein
MPALVALVWTTDHPVMPYVWSCSDCGAVFDAGTQRQTGLTEEQINSQFEVHCKQVHPGILPVIGLTADS